MKTVYLLDKNTKIDLSKISKDDILVSIDITTHVNLIKKNLNSIYIESFLDARGHKYIAENTQKILKITKNFNYEDKNGLKNTYYVNFERKIYFFLTNYFYFKYICSKFYKRFNKKKFKIINILKDNFNPGLEVTNSNNLYGFFFNTKNKVILKKNKKIINLRLYNKSILKLIFLFAFKNYIFIVPDDFNLKSFILSLKKKYKFSSLIFLNNNYFNFFKKYFQYLLTTFKISENLLLDNKLDSKINISINNIFKNKINYMKKDSKLNYLIKIYSKNYIVNYLNELMSKSINLYKLFEKHKPKLIISKRSSNLSYAVGEIANKLNLDSILISHASHIVNKNKLSMFDWIINSKSTINSDYKFVASQSKFSGQFLKKIDVKSKIINTGPIILTAPSKDYVNTENKKKKIILQASTPKNISNFRPINYETINDYIENIRQQIIALNDKKNVFIIIKFREYNFLKLEDFKYLLPKTNNYKIDTYSSLKTLLYGCDYLSSYSSTVIEEAIFFKKDIILYDKNNLYKHLTKKIIHHSNYETSKIYYCKNQSELKKLF